MKRDFRVINIFTLLNGWRMLRRLMRKAFWSRTINQLRWDDVAAILLDYSKIIRKTFWLVSCSTGSFESACLMLVINQTKYSSKQHSVWHSKYHHFSRRFEISLLALNAILFPFLTSCNKKKNWKRFKVPKFTFQVQTRTYPCCRRVNECRKRT